MKPLLKIREPEVLMTGLFPSIPTNQLALWKEGENILFFDNRVSKLDGYSAVATVPDIEDIVEITQGFVSGNEVIYYATPTKLYKRVLGVQTEIGTGYAGSNWSLETYGNWLLATNDYDALQVYKNDTGDADPLSGVNFSRAKIVRKLENHVIVFNTNLDGKEGRWSSKSNPELWEPAEDNSAGGLPVRDLDSDIVAAEYMGDVIGFYSSNTFGVCQYVGNPFWFGMKRRLEGIGAVGQYAIVQVSNEHFGMGPSGVFRNNGVSFEYVDTPAIKRWVKDNADPLYLSKTQGVHYQAKDMVIWSFRCKDGQTRGIGYNYKNRSWTIILLGITAFDGARVIEGAMAGKPLIGVGRNLGFFDTGLNSNGAALPARIRTNALDAGEMDRWKRWDMVRLETEQIGAAQIRFGFGETPGVVDYWTNWQTLARENWIMEESVYLTIEVRSTETNQFWAITGIEIFGEMTGYQR